VSGFAEIGPSSARTLGLDSRARRHRVIGEISGGDTASRLDRVLASMRIQKKEFDDITKTYESLKRYTLGFLLRQRGFDHGKAPEDCSLQFGSGRLLKHVTN